MKESIYSRIKKKSASPTYMPITKREEEVLYLISRGFTGRQIAKKLFISEGTVDTHRTRIRRKTNCRNAAGLTRFAFEQGLSGRMTR